MLGVTDAEAARDVLRRNHLLLPDCERHRADDCRKERQLRHEEREAY
jgi:hypothetical protein